MSREKECKCCHEWWYASVIKEDLCPNCYDYFKQLKQQLAEKETLIKGYQDEEKLIAKILGDESLTIIGSRVHLENLIVELRNKIRYKDLIIEEKDKEIEEKMMSFEKRCQEYYKSDEFKRDFAIQELEKVEEACFNQKELVDFGNVACFMVDIADILEIINNQIKELKGEKDERI